MEHEKTFPTRFAWVAANLTVSQASSYVLSPTARTLSEAFDQLKAELVTECGDGV